MTPATTTAPSAQVRELAAMALLLGDIAAAGPADEAVSVWALRQQAGVLAALDRVRAAEPAKD